jgi:hypothetical protein
LLSKYQVYSTKSPPNFEDEMKIKESFEDKSTKKDLKTCLEEFGSDQRIWFFHSSVTNHVTVEMHLLVHVLHKPKGTLPSLLQEKKSIRLYALKKNLTKFTKKDIIKTNKEEVPHMSNKKLKKQVRFRS